MLKQVRLYIKGDVIGVGFRAWTKIQSKFIGVTGQVRNVFDKPHTFGHGGGVEALIQGPEEKVDEMIVRLKQGPPVSLVEAVEIIQEDPKTIFENFEIIK